MPVTFVIDGKTYTGDLSEVHGSAGHSGIFHLMIDNYYCGRLRFGTHEKEWVFDPTPKSKSFAQLAEYFGRVVTAWHDST